jgi:hypothetical protein
MGLPLALRFFDEQPSGDRGRIPLRVRDSHRDDIPAPRDESANVEFHQTAESGSGAHDTAIHMDFKGVIGGNRQRGRFDGPNRDALAEMAGALRHAALRLLGTPNPLRIFGADGDSGREEAEREQ